LHLAEHGFCAHRHNLSKKIPYRVVERLRLNVR
jgi:hypothetical protein